jgi:hypothetical protein
VTDRQIRRRDWRYESLEMYSQGVRVSLIWLVVVVCCGSNQDDATNQQAVPDATASDSGPEASGGGAGKGGDAGEAGDPGDASVADAGSSAEGSSCQPAPNPSSCPVALPVSQTCAPGEPQCSYGWIVCHCPGAGAWECLDCAQLELATGNACPANYLFCQHNDVGCLCVLGATGTTWTCSVCNPDR